MKIPLLPPIAIAILVMTVLPNEADAQRRNRRGDGGNGQTPRTVQESIRSAEEKEAARINELTTNLSADQESHIKKQDRATRKRMRQTARRSERYRTGRHTPWWKRIFGRRNRVR